MAVDKPELAKRMLSFLREHPGVKLVAIEKEIGVSRIVAGRIVRALMDEGKVRRDEDTRQYYLI
jgi:DNA-binding IclR family transcriptional regulator